LVVTVGVTRIHPGLALGAAFLAWAATSVLLYLTMRRLS
jgi:hypothetical protein